MTEKVTDADRGNKETIERVRDNRGSEMEGERDGESKRERERERERERGGG